jgi:hypothetical protein
VCGHVLDLPESAPALARPRQAAGLTLLLQPA